MKFTSKAKMPEPAHRGPTGTGTYFDSYTKQQMEAYANERVREFLVYLCDEAIVSPIDQDLLDDDGAKATAWHISAKIRALINDDTE